MKFFLKCIAIFLLLTVLLTVGGEFLLELPLSATVLFSAVSSLMLTVIYGWIDDVYIEKRQAFLNEQ